MGFYKLEGKEGGSIVVWDGAQVILIRLMSVLHKQEMWFAIHIRNLLDCKGLLPIFFFIGGEGGNGIQVQSYIIERIMSSQVRKVMTLYDL